MRRGEAAGIAVPEQVAIVGAENYLLAPDAMITLISSVDTNQSANSFCVAFKQATGMSPKQFCNTLVH